MFSICSSGPLAPDFRRALKRGCLSENTNVAVSEGVKPWSPRERENRSNTSNTGLYSGARILPDGGVLHRVRWEFTHPLVAYAGARIQPVGACKPRCNDAWGSSFL